MLIESFKTGIVWIYYNGIYHKNILIIKRSVFFVITSNIKNQNTSWNKNIRQEIGEQNFLSDIFASSDI